MTKVSVQISGQTAVVTIDNPPVNAISHAVRTGLIEACAKTNRPDVKAVVLVCSGSTFVAGADVKEFSLPPKEPHLPDILTLIQSAERPWVAAIHGTALGGGCELALACSHRIADGESKIGLPEVTLGLIPGAGGTVRLPRLIPVLSALEMITTGKPVDAAKALSLGLVDRVSQGNLVDNAMAFAVEVVGTSSASLNVRKPIEVPTKEDWDAAAQKLTAKARGQNSPYEAVAAVRDAVDLPASEALDQERARFLRLKDDPQSAALRHIFFAERTATRLDKLKGIAPRKLKQIGVIGGGTMGAGISAVLLLSGLSVTMIERKDAALNIGMARIAGILKNSMERGLISTGQRATMTRALIGSTEYGALANVDLVIEAVFESMDVKKDVFAKIEAVIKPEAVLATNTSYLDIGELAESVTDPSRVLGLHFFSPAHIMKLLEIVHPPKVADDVLATGFALAKRLRKIAVPAGVCDGFIGNRIMSAYRRECDFMLEDGALPQDIDTAMRQFGFAMGIYAMQDMAGLDIGWAMRKRQTTTRDPKDRYVAIADKLCEAGRFGRKTGKGWFDYTGNNRGQIDLGVTEMILAASSEKGITRVAISADEIMQRILNVMQSEGEKILAEGVAQSSDAIDVVMVNGYGFPRWRGGPMYMMRGK